jgi:hypothetical protein
LYRAGDEWNMSMELCSVILTKNIEELAEKTSFIAILSATNRTRTKLGSKPYFCGEIDFIPKIKRRPSNEEKTLLTL